MVASEVNNNGKQTRGGRETEKNKAQGENSVNGTLERSRTLPTPMELHGSRSYQEVPNSIERSRTLPPPMELQGNRSCYQEGTMDDARVAAAKDSSQFAAQNAYPYYMHGVMNQVMMQSAAMMPQYGHHQHPHCPPNHLNGMTGFPYYHHHPMNTSLQNGHVPLQNGQMPPMVHHHHSWPQVGNHPSPNEVRVTKLDRREEALLKFRRKRNQRCFDKKIRYVNRKRLAERRPRVKGQFVRKMNGVNVDLNGQPEPDSADYDDEEEEDEEEEENRDSSPQDDALGT